MSQLVTFGVLFDIDGTLLSSAVAEDVLQCYLDAIRGVVGQCLLDLSLACAVTVSG
ncbi:MAG: hypothetical protein ABSA92_12120 [Candidatus Bathyarchaeia archaeon]